MCFPDHTLNIVTMATLHMVVSSWTICTVHVHSSIGKFPTNHDLSKYETNSSILSYSDVSAFIPCQPSQTNLDGTNKSATVFSYK